MNIERALHATRNLPGEELDVVFHGCTILYVESFLPDELGQKGFSKDHTVQETQVLSALLVTQAGLPVGYEFFSGATFEGHSLLTLVTRLQQRYALNKVIFVADCGVFSEQNLQALEATGMEKVLSRMERRQHRRFIRSLSRFMAY